VRTDELGGDAAGEDGAAASDLAGIALYELLKHNGYRGDQASVWSVQLFHTIRTPARECVLGAFGNFAASGSMLLGTICEEHGAAVPSSWASLSDRLSQLFAQEGLLVTGISTERYVRQLRPEAQTTPGQAAEGTEEPLSRLCFFNALQRNLSQEQMNIWERETSWAESAGDEEGFEDSL